MHKVLIRNHIKKLNNMYIYIKIEYNNIEHERGV